MIEMQIAETSIPTSARCEQEHIKTVERRRKATVIVCAVALRRLVSTGNTRLNCSANTSSSENISRTTSRQSGSETSWLFVVLWSACAALLLGRVELEIGILDVTLVGVAEPLKREYNFALSSTNWVVVVISLAESRFGSSLFLPSETCFFDR